MNSSIGDSAGEDIDFKQEFKTHRWMEIENDDRVKESFKLQN